MTDSGKPPAFSPLETVRSLSTELADTFVRAREIINSAGPIDTKHRELIMVAGFTTAPIEPAFRLHAMRALAAGATPEELRQAAALMMFATQGFATVAQALHWAEDVIEKHTTSQG